MGNSTIKRGFINGDSRFNTRFKKKAQLKVLTGSIGGIVELESNSVVEINSPAVFLAIANSGESPATGIKLNVSFPLEKNQVSSFLLLSDPSDMSHISYTTNVNWKVSSVPFMSEDKYRWKYVWEHDIETAPDNSMSQLLPPLIISTNYTMKKLPARIILYSDKTPIQFYPVTFILP